MLKTVEISRAKKTKGIAVTYRAGKNDMFGTCPSACKLNDSGKGASQIDQEYLDALLHAKPSRGVSFTYSHFHPDLWRKKMKRVNKTVINFSADNVDCAVNCVMLNIPAVTIVDEKAFSNRSCFTAKDPTFKSPVKVVRCPAEYQNTSCNFCGNGEPLCARMNRNFVVAFTAHGSNKRKAADKNTQGGCYGAQGNCRIWWNETSETVQDETDAEKLKRFVSVLPPRSIIRHHVAGDIGEN
tara:strand:- start:3167 stop:3886 length:720 start_codon:yes stop_codon:yes gene_type:complete